MVTNDDIPCGDADAVNEGGFTVVRGVVTNGIDSEGILANDVFNNPNDPKNISVTDAPDFGTLICDLAGDPNFGTANFCSDGSYKYTHVCTPANDANNVETIKYKINDGTDDSNEGTLTICINNVCPVAETDNYLLMIVDGGTLLADGNGGNPEGVLKRDDGIDLSLIHISEPTSQERI